MVVEKGVYKVKESGPEFQFGTQQEDTPTTPEKYLHNFRYVKRNLPAVCVHKEKCLTDTLACVPSLFMVQKKLSHQHFGTTVAE